MEAISTAGWVAIGLVSYLAGALATLLGFALAERAGKYEADEATPYLIVFWLILLPTLGLIVGGMWLYEKASGRSEDD